MSEKIPVFGFFPSDFDSWEPSGRVLSSFPDVVSRAHTGEIRLDPLLSDHDSPGYWAHVYTRITGVLLSGDYFASAAGVSTRSSHRPPTASAEGPERTATTDSTVHTPPVRPPRRSTPSKFPSNDLNTGLPLVPKSGPISTATSVPGLSFAARLTQMSTPVADPKLAPPSTTSPLVPPKEVHSFKKAGYFSSWRKNLEVKSLLYPEPNYGNISAAKVQPGGAKANRAPSEYTFKIWLLQLLRTYHSTLGSLEPDLLAQYVWHSLSTDVQTSLQQCPSTIELLCGAVELEYPFSRCTDCASPVTQAFLNSAVIQMGPCLNLQFNSGHLATALGKLVSALGCHRRAVDDRVSVLGSPYTFVQEIEDLNVMISHNNVWFADDTWRENVMNARAGDLSGTNFVSFAHQFFKHQYQLVCEAVVAKGTFAPVAKSKKIPVVAALSTAQNGGTPEAPLASPPNPVPPVSAMNRVFRLSRTVPQFPDLSIEDDVSDVDAAWTCVENHAEAEMGLHGFNPDSAQFRDLDDTRQRILKVMKLFPNPSGNTRPPSEANLNLYRKFLSDDPRSPEATSRMNLVLSELKRHESSFCYQYLKYSICEREKCIFPHICREGYYHLKSRNTLGPCSHVPPEVHTRAQEFALWDRSRRDRGGPGSSPPPSVWHPSDSPSPSSAPRGPVPTKTVRFQTPQPQAQAVAGMIAQVTAAVTSQLEGLLSKYSPTLVKTHSSDSESDPPLPAPPPASETSGVSAASHNSVMLVSCGGDVGLRPATKSQVSEPDPQVSTALLARYPIDMVLAALAWVTNKDRNPVPLRMHDPARVPSQVLSVSQAPDGTPLDDLAFVPMMEGAPMIYLQLYVSGMAVIVAYDGGACVSFVNPRVIARFKAIGITFEQYRVSGGRLKAYGGSDVDVLFAYVIPTTIGNQVVKKLYYLGSDTECTYDFLIGREFQQQANCSTNEEQQTVTWKIKGVSFNTPILPYDQVHSFVDSVPRPVGSLRTSADCTIPPNSVHKVRVVSKVVAAVPFRMMLNDHPPASDGSNSDCDEVRLWCRPVRTLQEKGTRCALPGGTATDLPLDATPPGLTLTPFVYRPNGLALTSEGSLTEVLDGASSPDGAEIFPSIDVVNTSDRPVFLPRRSKLAHVIPVLSRPVLAQPEDVLSDVAVLHLRARVPLADSFPSIPSQSPAYDTFFRFGIPAVLALLSLFGGQMIFHCLIAISCWDSLPSITGDLLWPRLPSVPQNFFGTNSPLSVPMPGALNVLPAWGTWFFGFLAFSYWFWLRLGPHPALHLRSSFLLRPGFPRWGLLWCIFSLLFPWGGVVVVLLLCHRCSSRRFSKSARFLVPPQPPSALS